MDTIPTANHGPTVPSSLTASSGTVHEAHTLMTLNAEVRRCDADVQPRLALSDAHIRAYTALFQEGQQLGTIVVLQDGLDSYLADGFHRVAAAKSRGLEALPAAIRVGTKRDAMFYACGANKHDKPLSNVDKQRVVLHLLDWLLRIFWHIVWRGTWYAPVWRVDLWRLQSASGPVTHAPSHV